MCAVESTTAQISPSIKLSCRCLLPGGPATLPLAPQRSCRALASPRREVFKALQLLALASVASFLWLPTLYCPVLLVVGQYLNFK
jgi:hypothetical protein